MLGQRRRRWTSIQPEIRLHCEVYLDNGRADRDACWREWVLQAQIPVSDNKTAVLYPLCAGQNPVKSQHSRV